MRAVVQRVKWASVDAEGERTGEIAQGFMVLLGVMEGDTPQDTEYIVKKIAGLRIFEDEQDKMNLSVGDVGGSILLVSQFTLAGDARHGNRPSFSSAARPEIAAAEVSPGIAIISSPTEHTQVIASSFSSESAPADTASIMPISSLTGMKAPESPPTWF